MDGVKTQHSPEVIFYFCPSFQNTAPQEAKTLTDIPRRRRARIENHGTGRKQCHSVGGRMVSRPVLSSPLEP